MDLAKLQEDGQESPNGSDEDSLMENGILADDPEEEEEIKLHEQE